MQRQAAPGVAPLEQVAGSGGLLRDLPLLLSIALFGLTAFAVLALDQ